MANKNPIESIEIRIIRILPVSIEFSKVIKEIILNASEDHRDMARPYKVNKIPSGISLK